MVWAGRIGNNTIIGPYVFNSFLCWSISLQ
jgi:hypothetical protein